MATKKAASTTKKSTAKKSSPAKTKKPAAKTKIKTSANAAASAQQQAAVSSGKKSVQFPSNLIAIIGSEIIGTFVLTMVALLTLQETLALYVGLTVALLVMVFGVISGAHFNPAVTFGLWAARRFKLVLVPFYWAAQLLGALAAVAAINLFSGGNYAISLGNFLSIDWSIFGVELIGTAVFLFGLIAVISRKDTSAIFRGIGVGFSIIVGVLVAGNLLSAVQSNVDTSKIESYKDIPHVYRIKGATLNPAVALASTEKTDSQFQGSAASKDEEKVSRFGLEVILGTLAGAAIGTNLYLLVTRRSRVE